MTSHDIVHQESPASEGHFLMTAVMGEKDCYQGIFQGRQKQRGREPAWLWDLRQGAMDRFGVVGLPTTDDEEWRFTPLTSLAATPLVAAEPRYDAVDAAAVERLAPACGAGHRLVFVNGHFVPHLSSTRGLPEGVVVTSLVDALRTHAEVVEMHLARLALASGGCQPPVAPFAALNTALWSDGAFVSLPRGRVVEQPVLVLFLATSPGVARAVAPRNLVIAEPNSQVTLVEAYAALAEDVYATFAVTEVHAAEGAVVDYYRVQRESPRAFHLSMLQVEQGKSANFRSHAFNFGGRLVRNDIGAGLQGERGECTLNGLSLGDGERLIDNHTRIDHARARCASHELYKSILDGRSRGVFNGKIYVHQDAQKTDAKQTNQTLLLSDDAVIDTKPQLEIFADDVKCTHGATIGQLDAEALFYLQSRGIGRDEARAMLTFAFANDIIDRVKVEPLRRELAQSLLTATHLGDGEAGKESV